MKNTAYRADAYRANAAAYRAAAADAIADTAYRAATYSAELRKANSITVNSYLDQGGEITSLKTFNRGEMDREYHIFTARDRDGTYLLDNSGVSWWDFEFGAVVSAIDAAEEMMSPRGIGEM